MRSLPEFQFAELNLAYILDFKLLQEMQRFRSLSPVSTNEAEKKRDCLKHEIIAFHSSEAC
jgi:CRISPR/Cas system endoribonuclease Cas6 (RAMP superfamily)